MDQGLSVVRPTTPSARIRFADCYITDSAQTAAHEVLESGWVTQGRQVAAFESEFGARLGGAHAVAVSSCTAALELALRSLGAPPAGAVLVSTMTFCGAVQAIVHAGLRPVLVDVSPVTGMPTVRTTQEAAQRCGSPVAMVVVHWAGDPADVPALAAAAGLPLDRVVEDAAHALGARRGERVVGDGGTACFSFYATKNLPIGEGGMVTTHDPERAGWIRRARLHGMSTDAWRRYLPGGSWRYDVVEAGLKANMTDLQAAIGRAQLRHLDAWQVRRAALAQRYDAQLADLAEVELPHRPASGAGHHAWHLYPVRLRPTVAANRNAVIAALDTAGIGTSVHFQPVHSLTYFRSACDVPDNGLPGAETLFEQLISLPLYPRLDEDEVDRVCAALRTALSPPRPPQQRVRLRIDPVPSTPEVHQ